jgi:protein-disulfide isomerase
MRPWTIIAAYSLSMLLAGCAAAQPASAPTSPPAPSITAAPQATAAAQTSSSTTTPSSTPTTNPTPIPPTVMPPTPTLGMIETASGPVTPSMARLRLAAEPYARLGDPHAPITVVEFADFGCEYCHLFHVRTFSTLLDEYIMTGKVYYVFKDLPVTSRHGALAAQAAECAGAQGRYWELHDLLFEEPEHWYGTEEEALNRIQTVALASGLDGLAIKACVAAGSQLPNVDSNFTEAQALRVYGTPVFFINAKLLVGAQPPEIWRGILDRELATIAGQ